MFQQFYSRAVLLALTFLCFISGCATHKDTVNARPFDFEHDTFAYGNDLVWDYYFDEAGEWKHKLHEPKSDYTHHCFVVARAAKQFFEQARFDSNLPKTNAATYEKLIGKVVRSAPSRHVAEPDRIVIPGYANLKEFSAAYEQSLKDQSGGAWRSYFQHGHWRSIMAFSRKQQVEMAQLFLDDLAANHPPIVHLVRFPQLTINHAIMVFDAEQTPYLIRFKAYDPNKPDAPKIFTFDRVRKEFYFPANDYFCGGMVNAYEVYRNWKY